MNGTESTAIGAYAIVRSNHATAIGAGAVALENNQIVLGTGEDTVYIPGKLIVEGDVFLAMGNSTKSNDPNVSTAVYLRESTLHHDIIKFGHATDGGGMNSVTTNGSVDVMERTYYYEKSDRRLKNVGKAFTGGLAELKKLDLFNYTYKKDNAKTPHVGVMAQDLQKVFPDAVTKGEDGFLRIRMEDMFYALVNAVKELDKKIQEFKDQEFVTLKNKVADLEKENAELKKQNKAFEKRLEALEKKIK